ncbi:MAG: hypothetical protein GF353_27925 [Candidatus Lokiarchaeota archaeon]|nr:hypothetical protein [Candidatus Lokiarchaeota archaeon]
MEDIRIKVLRTRCQLFFQAIKENLDYIEFDVRRTSDNIPIIYHDRDLK